MIFKERSMAMVFEETTNYDFILPSNSGIRRKFSWRGVHSVSYGGH